MKRGPQAAVLAAAAICAAAAAVAAGEQPDGPATAARPAPPTPVAESPGPPSRAQPARARTARVDATAAEAEARARRREEARRSRARERRARAARRERREKARARAAQGPPRTVEGSIRRARDRGRIQASEARAYTSRWRRAQAALRRLPADRAAELRAVVDGAERLAAAGRLSAGRMPAVFTEVVRNERFWSRRGAPEPGRRFTFAGDPVILQYYPGQGLRIQPLASAGKANALYNACRGHNTRPGTPCRKRALGRLLDRLVDLGAGRGGFTAWEYYFGFSGGRAPWISAMAQGTVIQALARGHRLLGGDDGYLDAAREGLGAFETGAPAGVAVAAPGGTHYAMYSQQPGLKVLNGFLQAVAGLQTYARVSGDKRAWRLFRAGESAARRAVPEFDTGGWSLYSKPGGESTLEYHRLVRDFLGNLCRRDGGEIYCRTEKRFTSYMDEPPRVHVRPIRGARRGRPLRVRFMLSRNAVVTVTARSADGGRTVFKRALRLGRGRNEVRWTPRGSQRYRVEVSVRDRSGRRASADRLARVR